MSSESETIYVALLDEGLDVWRPVAARKVAPDTYLILDQNYDRDVETWEFEPGAIVRCRPERQNGRELLVATEAVRRTPNASSLKNSLTQDTPSWRGKLKLSLVTCRVSLCSTDQRLQASPCTIEGVLSVESFVDQLSIDCIFLKDPYYLLPDDDVAKETYAVVYEAMRRKGVAAISHLKFQGEERQVALLPGQRLFRLFPLRRLDEIVQERAYSGQMSSSGLEQEMIYLAEKLVDLKIAKFEPEISKIGQTGITSSDLETAVDEGIRIGKIIDLKQALEKSVRFRGVRSGKSQSKGSR